ncbi:patched domain-containing protein 3-like isoform X1, partial [Argonauta hians]
VHKLVLSLNSSSLANISLYCSSLCKFESLLSIWNYNETAIRSLTNKEILAAVNAYDEQNHNLDEFLHVSQRDAFGQIVGADATKMTWKLGQGLTDKSWEHNFTDMFFHNNPTMFKELHPMTSLYYEDSGKGFDDDILFIAVGYSTMIIYIFFALGKSNSVDHKVGLAFTGLLCVTIGYVITLGVCGFFQLEFSVLNKILPLLLLGIGVDDMFVIVGALNNLSKKEKNLPVEEQIGLTMKHAGVSITITTLSDILAFAIGATSAFPGLRSFCIYNCVGILLIYLMVIGVFSSCVGLDLRRVLGKRDALFCCCKHSNHKPNRFSEVEFLRIIFLTLAKRLLIKKPIKVLVVIFTLALCGFCSWNIYQLEVQNSYVRVLYSLDAPYYSYAEADEKYFSSHDVGIYCRDIPYRTQQLRYLNMSHELLETSKIDTKHSRNWMMAFHQWAQTKNYTFNGTVIPEKFDSLLYMYLKQAEGWLYVKFVEVHRNEQCPMKTPKSDFCFDKICGPINSPCEKMRCRDEMNKSFVSSCSCNVTHMLNCWCQTPNCTDEISKDTSIKFLARCFPTFDICFKNETQYSYKMKCFNKVITYPMSKILLKITVTGINKDKLDFMNHLEDISEKYFPDSCIASAENYIQWKMNHVLEMEIKRNICLAFLSVFLITSVMIMNWKTSLMVVISVVLTLVDICGFLRVWGLYVDTTSCVIITIAVGLVVDFSVHVGFAYMTMKGPEDDRMIITLKEMGPPVFHGGFSTFIAVLPLCLGDTYPFKTFFKVFFLVITFGLFHGLIFLPVILSLYAPPPYPSAKTVDARRLSVISNDFFQIISQRWKKKTEYQTNTNQSESTEHLTYDCKAPYHISDYKLDSLPISKQQWWEKPYFISTQLNSNPFHPVFTFTENHSKTITETQKNKINSSSGK